MGESDEYGKQGNYYIVLFLLFLICFNATLVCLDHYGINRTFNDLLLFFIVLPLCYAALNYKRSVYLFAAGAAFVSATLTIYSIEVAHFYSTFNTLLVTGLVSCFALELIFRNVNERRRVEAKNKKLNIELQQSIDKLRKLSEMLPICSVCKKMEVNEDAWLEFESYLRDQLDTEIMQCVCDKCVKDFVHEFGDEPTPEDIDTSQDPT
jgi:hypothetical protein